MMIMHVTQTVFVPASLQGLRVHSRGVETDNIVYRLGYMDV